MTALAAGRRARIETEAFADAARAGVPITLQLSLTNRCNLRCVHCYCAPHEGRELSTAEVLDVLAQAAAAGTFVLVATGGEPLCRRDLPEILERAMELRFATKLYTNATLIDEAAADMVHESGVFQVHTSVYSADAAVHDGITGVPGSLAASLAGIRRLRRRGVRVMLKCVVMKPNLATFSSVLSLAEELGASCAFDPVVTVRTDGATEPLELRLGPEELAAALAGPALAAAARDEVVPGEFAGRRDAADAAPCSAGFNTFAVSPCGDVTPCVAYPSVAGNVREARLDEIWRDSPVFARVRATRLRDIAQCGACPDLGECRRCPGSALLEDGDERGPSRAACQLAAARRSAAGKEAVG